MNMSTGVTSAMPAKASDPRREMYHISIRPMLD
jgi:hypothetical protein